MIGVEKCPSMPGMDELNYLIDQMESAFSAVGLSVEKHEPKERTTPSDVDQQGADSTQEKSMQALPSELFASTQSPLAIPMKVLLGLPAEVWSFSSPFCDPVLKWIEREAVDSLKDARSLLTGRLSVPVLTELIETVVLGGGKLNLLRLVALVGSIPMTLVHSSGGKSTGGKSTKSVEQGSQQKATEKSQEDDTDEALQWLLFSISLVNALLIGARAVFEQAKGGKKVDTAIRILYGVSGAFALAASSSDLYLASKFKTQKARDYGYAHGVFGLAQGVWLCVMAGIRGREGVEAIDAAIEIVIGLAEIGTTIGAVAEGASDSEELGGTGFRLSNWSLKAMQKVFDGADNYTGTNRILSKISGSAKILSVATCGLMAAVDISEAIYTAHGHAS